MGIAISSQASLAPISLVSTLLGFISFAFTVATFLNVFWSNLQTISAAPNEIDDYLGTLKQGLYEERGYLRVCRRRRRRHSNSYSQSISMEKNVWPGEKEITEEDISMRVTRGTLRHMIRKFRELEFPFLEDWDRENRISTSENSVEEEPAEWYENRYRKCGLSERIAWLRRKKDVTAMLEALSRMQIRRIAREVGEMSFVLREIDQDVRSTEHRIYGLEQRLSRVVGVRRVD